MEGPAEKEVEACPPMKITPPSSTDSIIVPEQATPTGGVSNGGVDAEISSLSLKPASQRRSSLRANERDESVSLDEHDMIVTGVGLGQEASDQRQGDKEAATETLSPAEATPAPSTTITVRGAFFCKYIHHLPCLFYLVGFDSGTAFDLAFDLALPLG